MAAGAGRNNPHSMVPPEPPVPISPAARAGGASTARLAAIMERLRGEDGCPWDREQTWASLRRYVIEEAFELVEAIGRGDPDAVREECGDLLLEVVFVARIAAEAGRFGLAEVARDVGDKLIRRHPHVFGGASPASGTAEALASWEEVKAQEKAAGKGAGRRRVPALPALLAASKLLERDGLDDLPSLAGAAAALAAAAAEGDAAEVERAGGELLLASAAAVRDGGADPEVALRSALERRWSAGLQSGTME